MRSAAVPADHLRYQCVACGHLIADTPAERKAIARSGQFVRLNPRAPRHVSFHWNALLPPWVSWRSIVEEFIHACHAARLGDIQPLKTFINENLARALLVADPRLWTVRKEPAGWLWALCHETAVGGNPPGIRRQRGQLHDRFRVQGVGNLPLQRRHGLETVQGNDAEHCPAKDSRTKKRYRSLWAKTFVDPAFGTAQASRVKIIPLFLSSNPMTKDLLTSYTQGLIGDWTLPREIARNYLKQVAGPPGAVSP